MRVRLIRSLSEIDVEFIQFSRRKAIEPMNSANFLFLFFMTKIFPDPPIPYDLALHVDAHLRIGTTLQPTEGS